MQKLYFFIIFSFYIMGFTQNTSLYYSGYFFDNKAIPHPFLKVTNHTQGKYELTDDHGYLIIAAQPGDTLIWNKGENFLVLQSYQLNTLKYILERNQNYRESTEMSSPDYAKSIDSINQYKSDYYPLNYEKIDRSSNFGYGSESVKLVEKKNDTLYQIKRLKSKKISINGSFTTQTEINFHNGLPKLQQQYVQGKSQNGMLVWYGPESDLIYSYGPDIATLGYDGIPNQYDINGNLVTLKNAKNIAQVYSNNIIKPQIQFSNYLNFNAGYYLENSKILESRFKFGHIINPLYFDSEFTKENQFSSTFIFDKSGFKINLGYQYTGSKATNTNRFGYFTRVYQNSLLTPISFNNKQSSTLQNGNQRSYSSYHDNPIFLLDDGKKYNATSDQNLISFNFEKNIIDDLKLHINSTYKNIKQDNQEYYKPSTAFFPNGINNIRKQDIVTKSADIQLGYETGNYQLQHRFSLKFLLNDYRNHINESLQNSMYQYNKTTREFLFAYQPTITIDEILELNIHVANTTYATSTASKKQYWQPKASVKINFPNIFTTRYGLSVFGAYSKVVEEASILQTYSDYGLTQLLPNQNLMYFPILEVENFNNLSFITKTRKSIGIEVNPFQQFVLSGEYFNTKINQDILPTYENGKIYLANLADHTMKGFEIKLSYENIIRNYDFDFDSSISFFRYSDIVDHVKDGYNYHPISGFSTVYKGLVAGASFGSIIGNSYLRNENGIIIIGDDGYPLVNSNPKIIGDAIPDYNIKLNNTIQYRDWVLTIDWHYNKGGEIWNGTQTALDYYGRSYQSGALRNTKNHVFSGVNTNGNPNTIAVNFYDTNQDVMLNRWTRYGITGVAEAYIEKADFLRISSITLSKNFTFRNKEIFQKIKIAVFANNLYIWKKYSGVDPQQSFYTTENGNGLDYFNLPGYSGYGFNFTLEF